MVNICIIVIINYLNPCCWCSNPIIIQSHVQFYQNRSQCHLSHIIDIYTHITWCVSLEWWNAGKTDDVQREDQRLWVVGDPEGTFRCFFFMEIPERMVILWEHIVKWRVNGDMLIKWWLQNSAHMAVHGRPKQVFFVSIFGFNPGFTNFYVVNFFGELMWRHFITVATF